ncbi:MAG: DNA mismatch repair protein MutS [Candidatus Melainabacteria bacterium RIFCSPLOWO2_02_FULL_35_15]|nr:MAG: DNA mismatch repair protein MutS [Candidatus Melainabacteria bacterium RIFCSPLOWO2_12_FULL_35_11]OGI14067.1 MAG: DNA mismatch repair protein MutS [Candidatus Melainabacteria bacterium RIFCSPLOWO2_02_FULL_35_15]
MNISLAEKEKTEQEIQWPQNPEQFTPLMRQFLEIKYKYDLDVLLFFRVGDFYETFFEDAKIISKELELTLTGRAETNYPNGRIPMAGVPAKAVINYVSKLLDKGFKVAICDQMEDPVLAKGIVKREVTKLLTPGTVLETDWLPQTKNNFIASVYKDKKRYSYGFAYADVSSGEFFFTELNFDELISELNRTMPSEVLIPVIYKKNENQIVKEKTLDMDVVIKENWFCTGLENEYFNKDFANKRIKEELQIQSIESLGGIDLALGQIASGAILAYIDKTQLVERPNFEKIIPYRVNSFLNLDKMTRKNLELTESIKDKCYSNSLLWAIDFTKTQMGKRRLRAWIEQPLLDLDSINLRLNCIEELIQNKYLFCKITKSLEKIFDLERISSRLSASAVNAKELIALKESLMEVPSLSAALKNLKSPFLQKIINYPGEIVEVVQIIENAILDNPSNTLTEGNLIKPAFNNEIKQLKEIMENGDSYLESFETIERERTGIKNLKVGFNRTFGYFIEISKGNLPLVPPEYICRQTMVNSSRFITNELKEFEQKALHAEQRTKTLEYEIFCQIREKVKSFGSIIRELAYNISCLDTLFSFSQAAVINNYKRPVLNNSGIIDLKASRHPVIEKKAGFNNFISNDCYLEYNKSKQQLIILTGPNMAGKSTYMRQIALNIILAQSGSFVPCDYAQIGIVDQIFTRVGASDDISEGQSTFMVEMTETGAILNRMTEKSLILLDEVGRGTSTYDGVAIAWALAEYLVKNKMSRTIFATHFHELNGLADLYESICNYQVTVKEEEGHVIFLRKVIPGGADKSYGIEVAKMAGLPKELLLRAQTIMNIMYNKSQAPLKKETIKSQIESGQLSLFN